MRALLGCLLLLITAPAWSQKVAPTPSDTKSIRAKIDQAAAKQHNQPWLNALKNASGTLVYINSQAKETTISFLLHEHLSRASLITRGKSVARYVGQEIDTIRVQSTLHFSVVTLVIETQPRTGKDDWPYEINLAKLSQRLFDEDSQWPQPIQLGIDCTEINRTDLILVTDHIDLRHVHFFNAQEITGHAVLKLDPRFTWHTFWAGAVWIFSLSCIIISNLALSWLLEAGRRRAKLNENGERDWATQFGEAATAVLCLIGFLTVLGYTNNEAKPIENLSSIFHIREQNPFIITLILVALFWGSIILGRVLYLRDARRRYKTDPSVATYVYPLKGEKLNGLLILCGLGCFAPTVCLEALFTIETVPWVRIMVSLINIGLLFFGPIPLWPREIKGIPPQTSSLQTQSKINREKSAPESVI